ncbi:hypothetical protein GALMADRAFT_80659 [Galerina marginata CBS 339.88]|uniref:Uncharacterized protein n=1 Tax=Galerina marginata (strain CBS 339.88) TaxID=685588 RepID=A0A067S6V8_GALM3|nr:hypothetical protein GALMADRAFT_80659 [Galerina marginata CBS 339.88]
MPFPSVIESFAGNVELAAENADSFNWKWANNSPWEPASKNWQLFRAKWYGAAATSIPSAGTSLSLEPLSRLNPDGPSILVRESYGTTFDHVWACAMSSMGYHGAIVTGQSGTGKTVFLFYLLVRLLQLKQPVLFSLNEHRLHLFYHDKVYKASTAAVENVELEWGLPCPKVLRPDSYVFLWSLFDTRLQHPPKSLLTQYPCLPVQTVSGVDPIQYRSWEEERMPLFVGLPLWTREELRKGLSYQNEYHYLLDELCKAYPNPPSNLGGPLVGFTGARELLKASEFETGSISSPSEAVACLLEASITRFGFSARDVFQGVFNHARLTQRHRNSCLMQFSRLEDAVRTLPNYLGAGWYISLHVLALSPVQEAGADAPLADVDWEVDFKSEWVARSVLQWVEKLELDNSADVLRKRVRSLRKIEGARTLADRFLEPLVHCAIAYPSSPSGSGAFWRLHTMSPKVKHGPGADLAIDSLQFVFPPGGGLRVPDDQGLARISRDIEKFPSPSTPDLPLPQRLANGEYYVPTDPAFPMFDAFIVDLDYEKKSAVLWALIITTSRVQVNHDDDKDGISVSGGPGSAGAEGSKRIRELVAKLKDQLGEYPPPKKTLKVNGAGSCVSESSSRPRVEVRYILIIPEGPGSTCDLEWYFPKGWNGNWGGGGDRLWPGNVYCMEVPIDIGCRASAGL